MSFHHQENNSLPVGPREPGALWYANNRLGYSCQGFIIWGAGVAAEGRRVALISRVLEKTSAFTCA
eukprot:10233098-Prorocentrum_lima.AAC.1